MESRQLSQQISDFDDKRAKNFVRRDRVPTGHLCPFSNINLLVLRSDVRKQMLSVLLLNHYQHLLAVMWGEGLGPAGEQLHFGCTQSETTRVKTANISRFHRGEGDTASISQCCSGEQVSFGWSI